MRLSSQSKNGYHVTRVISDGQGKTGSYRATMNQVPVQMYSQQTAIPTTPNEAILIQQNNVLFQENSARSQNEQALYNAWKNSEYERNCLTSRLNIIQQQFEQMQKDYSDMQNKYTGLEKNLVKISTTQKEEIKPDQYFTDEEKLAEETEWIRKKNRKKRRMDTSLSPPQQSPVASEKQKEQPKAKKATQPPPIIVDGITNFNALRELITKMMTDFQIKIINDKNIKINVTDGICYQALTKALNDNEYSWYSYENKQNRPIRVMAVNLHHSCEPEEIIQDMRKRGYKLLEATRKLKYKTKQPLNMFMLSFRNDENVEKIFSLTDIMGIRVQIQPIRKSKLVPQCKRCQTYGHTQRYCAKEPRCVRCIGKHLTANCDKPKSAPPKCVHCGEKHPANYRGCIVAKEIQKIKIKKMNKTKMPAKPQRENRENKKPSEQGQGQNKTYSQVATQNSTQTNKKSQHQDTTNTNTDNILKQILDKLNKMDERILNLEKRAQGAIPKTRNG